tara:strand:+ start:42 stop:440 length:399 start_codon:yes stop_codon:yes gene_type:complete
MITAQQRRDKAKAIRLRRENKVKAKLRLRCDELRGIVAGLGETDVARLVDRLYGTRCKSNLHRLERLMPAVAKAAAVAGVADNEAFDEALKHVELAQWTHEGTITTVTRRQQEEEARAAQPVKAKGGFVSSA